MIYHEGRAVKVLGAFQDITDFKRTEELLRRTSSLLKEPQAVASGNAAGPQAKQSLLQKPGGDGPRRRRI